MSTSTIRFQFPPALKRGDKVAVCAPSGPVEKDRLERGLAVLKQWFQVHVDEHVLATDGFLAGSDEIRLRALQHYLDAPEIKAIVCARGGYGTMRIIPHLQPDGFVASPKWLVGFSDISTLLAWGLAQGIATIHGPVVTQLGQLNALDKESLRDTLLGDFKQEHPLASTVHPQVEGTLLATNLKLLTSIWGTPFFPKGNDWIVVLEDVGERPYAIDRDLTSLEERGFFTHVRGVVAGDFVRCSDTTGPNALEVLQERLDTFQTPFFESLPVGHGVRNLSLVCGSKALISGNTLRVIGP